MAIPPSTTQPNLFRPSRTALVVMAASLGGAGIGTLISITSNWSSDQPLLSAALAALTVWLFAAILGVQVLIAATHRDIDRLGIGILASSMSRMLTALVLGVVVYFLLAPDGRTFWVCFLAAGLAALIAEAVWATRTINAATRPAGAPIPGAVHAR